MFISPCKDCPDRVLGCHSTCQKYIDKKAAYEKEREQLIECYNKENSYVSYVVGSKDRIKKRMKGGHKP